MTFSFVDRWKNIL